MICESNCQLEQVSVGFIFLTGTGIYQVKIHMIQNAVEPRYDEVGYSRILLWRGGFAGPGSLGFFVFLPWCDGRAGVAGWLSWSQGPRCEEVPLYTV